MATPSLRAAASVASGGRARHRARQGRRPPGGRPSGTPRAAGRGRGAAPGSRAPATSCRRRPVDRRAYHPHRSVHGAAALGRGNLQSGVGPQAGSGASDRWCPRDEARHWAQEPGEQPRNSPSPPDGKLVTQRDLDDRRHVDGGSPAAFLLLAHWRNHNRPRKPLSSFRGGPSPEVARSAARHPVRRRFRPMSLPDDHGGESEEGRTVFGCCIEDVSLPVR